MWFEKHWLVTGCLKSPPNNKEGGDPRHSEGGNWFEKERAASFFSRPKLKKDLSIHTVGKGDVRGRRLRPRIPAGYGYHGVPRACLFPGLRTTWHQHSFNSMILISISSHPRAALNILTPSENQGACLYDLGNQSDKCPFTNPIAFNEAYSQISLYRSSSPSGGSEPFWRKWIHFKQVAKQKTKTGCHILEFGTGHCHFRKGHSCCSPYCPGSKSSWTQLNLLPSKHRGALASQ